MWLFAKQGFYSVVLAADRDGQPPDTLAVRARRRQDLESLRRLAPALSVVVSMRHRDYPFRCFIRREDFSRLLADLGGKIDYENFKEEIASKSRFRAKLYGIVWGVMKHLEGQNGKAFSAAETAQAEITLAVDVHTATVPEEVDAAVAPRRTLQALRHPSRAWARLGGIARARRHSEKELSNWAKLGGRPRKGAKGGKL